MFLNRQQQATPKLEREVGMPGAAAAEALAATRDPRRKVALFVAHGMGQQVPFETMDCVAAGLIRIAKKGGRPAAAIRAETCLVGTQKLQRIELEMRDAEDRPLEVHVYEGYWAPFTEGQVKIADVMSFLLRGGFNGLRNAWKDFQRWMFGGPVNFGKRPRTGVFLTLALFAVVSLIVANFLVTVMFADRLAARVKGGLGEDGAVFANQTFTALTTLVAGWVIYSAAIGALLYVAHRVRGRAWTLPLGVLLWIWVAYTIALGVVPPLALLDWLDVSAFGMQFFNTHSVAVWVALLVVSAILRGVMIQFPGDVAAYISTHTLDRFQEIRTKIKERVGTVAKAIYASNEYEGVVWVGHSLGSVVAYDALNALIMDDELANRPARAVERTKLLLTFGSPLDKIAFIFASQWVSATETREALAASFQPLILDYQRFRSIPWINIWSPADIVSGELDFYDDLSKSNGREVQNMVDTRATTPLLAHLEYWQNRLLYERLYEALARPAAKTVASAMAR
jgi:hypothetical protein